MFNLSRRALLPMPILLFACSDGNKADFQKALQIANAVEAALLREAPIIHQLLPALLSDANLYKLSNPTQTGWLDIAGLELQLLANSPIDIAVNMASLGKVLDLFNKSVVIFSPILSMASGSDALMNAMKIVQDVIILLPIIEAIVSVAMPLPTKRSAAMARYLPVGRPLPTPDAALADLQMRLQRK